MIGTGRLDQWLSGQLAAAPEALRVRTLEAARTVGVAEEVFTQRDLPGLLRCVAEALLRSAKLGPPTRETALTLLAADALVTLAIQEELAGARP